jgi:hypothetical protein
VAFCAPSPWHDFLARMKAVPFPNHYVIIPQEKYAILRFHNYNFLKCGEMRLATSIFALFSIFQFLTKHVNLLMQWII